jgi:hypothetical protein
MCKEGVVAYSNLPGQTNETLGQNFYLYENTGPEGSRRLKLPDFKMVGT